MADDWKTGTPADVVRELRAGGLVYGRSNRFDFRITLHKTDFINDLKRHMKPNAQITYKIVGDPNQSGRYAEDRRTVVIWLGA